MDIFSPTKCLKSYITMLTIAVTQVTVPALQSSLFYFLSFFGTHADT